MFGYRTFIVIRSDFYHYESSVAEHVRIWSNQFFIDPKLGTFHFPSLSATFHLKPVFRLCFSCAMRIRRKTFWGDVFVFECFRS